MARTQRWVAGSLITTGVLVLLWVAAHFAMTARSQRDVERAIETHRSAPVPEAFVTPPPPATVPIGEAVGTLEIRRIRLSAAIVEGDDDSVLDRAAGHLPDTPLPWLDGNSAVAAHRDQLFRPLKDVRVGDLIELTTIHGDFRYEVRETMIVDPTDVWVLDPTPEPSLTLISCYPFNYIGNAPQRFIVRAARLPAAGAAGSSEGSSTERGSAEAAPPERASAVR